MKFVGYVVQILRRSEAEIALPLLTCVYSTEVFKLGGIVFIGAACTEWL